jgi:hypothetical protein
MKVFENVLRDPIGRRIKRRLNGAVLNLRVTAKGLIRAWDEGSAELPTALVAIEAGSVDGIKVGPNRGVYAALPWVRVRGIGEMTLAWRMGLILDAGQVCFEGDAAEVSSSSLRVNQ